jgi:hypothetical protein
MKTGKVAWKTPIEKWQNGYASRARRSIMTA